MSINTVFNKTYRCAVCSKPLTDPVSIARGIGPECLLNEENKWKAKWTHIQPDFFCPADFQFRTWEGVVCVLDTQDAKSVTNHIHAVLALIEHDMDIKLSERRIIYRDGAGVWDEVQTCKTDDGRTQFKAFRSLGGIRDMEQAIKIILNEAPTAID
ncbi:MAG: DUF6011 domain-containing protein [Gammaproteobacteria bacterium]|nr:DUF6011 domain-containing protein [Gammaproteobacteria bacterium]